MEDNYVGGSVSKSYSRMKQTKYKGINLKTWLAFGVWVIVSMIFVYPFTLFSIGGIGKIIVFSVLIVFWIGFFKYGRNSQVIDRSIIHFKFVRRAMRGETDLAKFVQDNTFLEKFLPIKKVHNDGLIEYLNGTWGVMLIIQATRVSNDNLFMHLEGIRHLHDGLYNEIYVTIISSTVLKHDNLLVDTLMDRSKETESIPAKEHLVDLHNMVVDNNQSYKGQEITLIINLGPHDSYEYADISREGFVPGYLSALNQANCTGRVVRSKEQVYREYRTKLNPMKV